MLINKKALVFESKTCKYDIILGADFLRKTGIDAKYCTRTIEWFENELPLQESFFSLTDKETLAIAEILEIQQEIELYGMDWYDPTCYAIEILDAKYEKVSTDDCVQQLDHLTPQQKKDLKEVLNTYTKLFNGTLGVYPHRKSHINLVDGAVPKHTRPYPVPVIHIDVFKK